MQRPLPPGTQHRKGVHSSNTGAAAGERVHFFAEYGRFCKKGLVFLRVLSIIKER